MNEQPLFTDFLDETKYGHQDYTEAKEIVPTHWSQTRSSRAVTLPTPTYPPRDFLKYRGADKSLA